MLAMGMSEWQHGNMLLLKTICQSYIREQARDKKTDEVTFLLLQRLKMTMAVGAK